MDFLLYWLLDFIGCSVARVVLDFFSFGRAFVDPANTPTGHFNWLGYRRDEAGRILVARDVAGFIGLMIIILFFLIVLVVSRFL